VKKAQELKDRIRICVDTCHIFSAGYDISDKNKVKEIFLKLENLFGLKNIGLIHLNDSKNELGSKLDRHANLFEGHITNFGKNNEGLISIISFAKKTNIPFVLETPFIDEKIEGEIKKIIKI
jgi:deoxyribonuclease-4